jgi:hypothetical protein
VIYLYAIGETEGRLAAFVKRGVARAPGPDPQALLDHDRVVYSLMKRGAVLPVRFGTVVGDEGEIRSLLVQRHKELRRLLGHVRGRVEFGVRGVLGAKPKTGGDYMQTKLRMQRSIAPLAELAADARLRHVGTSVVAAYLVDRERVEAFEERARAMELSLTGPWPPYSFSGALDG